MTQQTEARKQLVTSVRRKQLLSLKRENTLLPRNRFPQPEEGGASVVKRPTEATPTLPASPPSAVCTNRTPYPQPIEFFHAFNPPTATAQTRRHTRAGATYLPAGTRLAAATLQAVMEGRAPGKPLECPVRVALFWTYPWPGRRREGHAVKATRPDLDNLAKLALDAMTKAGYWLDDAQVVDLHTAKYYGDMPGLAVGVWPEAENACEVPR